MNKLPYDKLLKYMEYVFDAEMNVFIQTETIKRLNNTYNNLGRANNYKPPEKKGYTGVSPNGCTLLMVIPIIIIVLDILIREGDANAAAPFITFFIILLLLIIAYFVGGLLKEKKAQKEIDDDYNKQMSNYNLAVEMDKRRVDEENKHKTYIRQQINELERIRKKEREKLQELYSYNILAEKYRNLVAVSSIYEYLKYGRTKSLEFDGGDRGGYNIFEEEIRLNHIITNTEVIIQKLDTVIENQRELSKAIREADNSIKRLTTSVDNSSARLQSSMSRIAENQEISNYEQRRQRAELDYMNFMNTLYLYK